MHRAMNSRLIVPAGALLAGTAALILTAAVAAGADSGEADEAGMMNPMASAQATDRISDHFVTFAGGEVNATALVNGLHDGTAVTLTSTANGQTTTTNITPPTGPMGYGNVFLSLALAEAELTKLGITQPTAADVQAALTGGSVTTGSGATATTTALTGVLVLRNQGQGFGQIAQTFGVTLRSAVAAARAGMDSDEAAEAGRPGEAMKTPDRARATDRIGDHFVTFAGSEANADALVTGLHDGTVVSLTSTANGQTTTTMITPPAGQLSYRNVYLSLALAEEDLTKLGITQPTAADIQAALTGGSVTTGSGSTAVTTPLTGVLVLHHQGQSFSQIAQTLGVNLQTAVADARAATDANEAAEAGRPEEAMKTRHSGQVTDHLADHFATFAGGEDNATALVTGLRDGTAFTLTDTANGQTTTTTITPATGKMGFGNVFLALALAEEDLTKAGVSQPTGADIQAALDGGSVTTGSGSAAVTTPLPGVLALRNEGQGFGQIAQTLGVSLQTAIADARAGTDAAESAETAEAAEAGHAAAHAAAMRLSSAVAASANANAASGSHPDLPALSHRPDFSAVSRPQVPERPVIPMRPEISQRPEVPQRPEIPVHH